MKASLIINSNTTKSFLVKKGVRQGCPLSPLLFILVLEILLQKITNREEIKGLKIKNECYKYRAFADDIMFIMENPAKSIPKLFEVIKEFGDQAGFYVNKTKTKIMCSNMTNSRREELSALTGCEIANKVRYLGINLTMRNIDLLKKIIINYGTQFKWI